MIQELITAGEKNYTGYCDMIGNKIYIGSRITIRDYSGAIWRGTVKLDDGYITIDTCSLEQVKNPPGWVREHDWIRSRNCGCTIGYPEFGSWNYHRVQLPDITKTFKSLEAYKLATEKYLEKNNVKYAHESLIRPLPCIITQTKRVT